MDASNIKVGQSLKLKRDNPYGYAFGDLIVYVAELRLKGDYKTPWVVDNFGRAFKPSDFERVYRPVSA